MDNPYQAPDTSAYEELGEDIINSPSSETREESPIQKLCGRGIYTSFLFCVLFGASLLHSDSNLSLLIAGVSLLTLFSITYIILSVRVK